MILHSSLEVDSDTMLMVAEANNALGAGDTLRAAELFAEAGRRIESKIGGVWKGADKQLLWFLVATQYYHGGMYEKAQLLCRKIQAKLLPAEAQQIFRNFLRDVEDRASPDYPKRVMRDILRGWQAKDYRKVLAIFQDHPYVYSRGAMAFMRAMCCEDLKEYRAAALFFADSLRFEPNGFRLIFTAAARPLRLLAEGDTSEAWRYAESQLSVIRHAVPNVIASLIRFQQASLATSEDEMRAYLQEQTMFLHKALELFPQLPPPLQQDKEMRGLMALGLEAAFFGQLRLGNRLEAEGWASHATAFKLSVESASESQGSASGASVIVARDFHEAASSIKQQVGRVGSLFASERQNYPVGFALSA